VRPNVDGLIDIRDADGGVSGIVKHNAPADESTINFIEYLDQRPQVIGTRVAVIVGEGQDLSACAGEPRISRSRQSGKSGMHALNGKRRIFSESIEDAPGLVTRGIVHENELPAARW
jgi:hypothetical protein